MGMKRGIKWVAALGVLALAGAAVVLLWLDTTPEPIYKKKPLSHWLMTGYQPEGDEDWDEADKAMKQIGSNAIPILLHFLRVRDTKFELNILDAAKKYGLYKKEHIPAEKLNFAGAIGFRKLGRDGASAVPELVSIYSRNISSWSRSATVMAIDDLAPYSVPALDHELSRRGPREREMIAGALSRASAEPAAVVPVLARCLHDPDAKVRMAAATGLSGFGTNAQAAIPDLMELRKDTNGDLSHAADYALERIVPGKNQ